MSYDILSILQEKESTFSKGQKRIARYITEAYDKAAFMTANRLGKTVGVSESTVVRFAVDLGFDGYPSMQKAMQEMVLNRLTSVQRIEVANNRFGDQDVVSMVIQSDMEKLRQTGEMVSRQEFAAAVNAILKAKRVYILGVRSVAPLANFLGYYLNYMFNNVHEVTGFSSGEMFEKIVGVNSDDVVIAFSFPRYSSSTTKGAQYCRSAGATVIGITDSRFSPLGTNSDHVLIAKSDMVSLVDSLVAPLSLVNALIVAIAAKKEKELSQTFANLARIWDAYDVYEKRIDGK
jgi:DNA-binding MurR/RpiR family transcriptional regulator